MAVILRAIRILARRGIGRIRGVPVKYDHIDYGDLAFHVTAFSLGGLVGWPLGNWIYNVSGWNPATFPPRIEKQSEMDSELLPPSQNISKKGVFD